MTIASSKSDELHLDVESFEAQHPAVNGRLLVEHARVALAKHGASPRSMTFLVERVRASGKVAFASPDPRSANTLQQKLFTETGAVVMAGLLFQARLGLQITRVAPCGSRVDYFVGRSPGAQEAVVEVKGREDEPIETLASRASAQLAKSVYVSPAFHLAGFIAVTRFGPTPESLVRREHPTSNSKDEPW